MARVRKILPSRPITIQPALFAVGVIGPTTNLAYSIFFTTSNKASDDVVYSITKMLHEGKADLLKGHPVFRNFDPNRMTEEIGVPWHPGAIKFYKEVGQWPPKE